ncbi:gamma carbonic anhydrase family protein [Leucobacter sp. CSA1]|uniref:Gamma carbonic anhydrase family protein n=1 Tax=Leucobacter chromiisoli TaxID=2796471 RepID=A0A934Q607_9MICO|nr:gamma carbonic anhydrase family protein [Leucobacter chromiisoli]MBK0418033.1 gamma carbonic anhydrase family protein [Leucobacter chromiisoli]
MGGTVIALDRERSPRVPESAWVAPGAVVVGAVALGDGCSVWYHAVLRGDSDSISVGARSNLQDGVVLHADRGAPAVVGDDVSVGHGAVVHGATVGNGCLIGMNATVLSGAVIGEGTLVAAGAVVPQGASIPPGSLVAGVPGRVVRALSDEERAGLLRNAERYLGYTGSHRAATEERRREEAPLLEAGPLDTEGMTGIEPA